MVIGSWLQIKEILLQRGFVCSRNADKMQDLHVNEAFLKVTCQRPFYLTCVKCFIKDGFIQLSVCVKNTLNLTVKQQHIQTYSNGQTES